MIMMPLYSSALGQKHVLAAAEGGEENSSAWRPAIHRAGLSEGSTSASSQRRRVSMHTQDTPRAHPIDPYRAGPELQGE